MADYEELIGAKFTIDGFDQALAQFDAFIKEANERGKQLKVGVSTGSDGGALGGIVQQLQEVQKQLGSFGAQFKEVFGTGADAAQDSAKSIKQSVADAESAFVSAQKSQTEAASSQSAKRIEIAQNEANAIRRTQEELKAKSQITPEVSRYGSQFFQQEIQRIEAEKQKAAAELQRSRKNAPYRPDSGDEFAGSRGGISQLIAKELNKAEEAKANSGIGGFFHGVGKGLAPRGDSSAASIGEFVGQATRFVAAYAAIRVAAEAAGAAIAAPFEIIKGGIQYLTEFQERASQLKTTLLDHGFFSKDPAENLRQAGAAADALQSKVDDLADKLHVKSATIQAAFETFSGFGGNALTGSLGDSAQLAGLATGALQSQNPVIQQRTVATQLQKLTTGTLKDTDKLPAALGISAEKLNEMAKAAATTHDLLQRIQDAAPGLADRIGNANERFSSLLDTAERFWERLEGEIAKPTFDLLTEKLKELLKWLDDNKESIQQFANALGSGIATLISQFAAAGQALSGSIGGAIKNVLYNTTTLLGALGRVANFISVLSNTGVADNSSGDAGFGSFGKRLADKNKQINENEEASRRALFGGGGSDIDRFLKTLPEGDGYTVTTKPAPGKSTTTPGDEIGAIRNSYSEQVAEVKKQSAAVRSAIEEDAKNFRISLIDAADLKEAAYQEETEKIAKAGEKAKAALAKVVGGKDPAKTQNAKNSVLKSINENNLGVGLDSAKSLLQGQDAIDKQGDAVDAVNRAGDQQRATDLLNADYAYKQELQKKGLISDTQALDNEQTYWDKLYKIRLDGIQKSVEAETKDSLGDPKKLAELNQQRQTLLTQQGDQNTKLQRQRDDLAYNERQRQFGLQGERDQAAVVGANNQNDIDRHAGRTDSARRDTFALLEAQRQQLQTQQDQAVDTAEHTQQDFFKANPGATAADLAANPAYQAANNKVHVINAELIKTNQLISDTHQQGTTKEETLDYLFGPVSGSGSHIRGATNKDGSDSKLNDFAQTVSSIGNVAGRIGQGVGAIEQGYQRSGVGGAVGAGLGQVGSAIGGPVGQAIAGAGAVVSLLSDLFTQAARNIGKEVAHAVDKVMEKYSTGQATLNQALTTVQQQYATLVAKETGRKGGQQVLDTEGVQLQQQIDQLKQQQKQAAVSFADATIVAGGTNSVAQQWLQTWINVNKEVQAYKNAVGDTAAEQLANQYLNEQLDAQRKQLQDQYVQGQESAVNDALQYNQLLQQRNNYEDQYRQQVFSLQSKDSLARRGNPAEETARQISLAKSQYNQQTQQLNFEINTYQQKVAYETQIYGLAKNTADLQKQALADQGYQLQEQLAQAQTVVALLASITGLKAVNGSIPGLSSLGINLPVGFGINDGSLNPIPGFGAPGTVDNSTTTINVTVPASALPANGTPADYAAALGNELKYALRTRGAAAL
jgi:hypothetical protein